MDNIIVCHRLSAAGRHATPTSARPLRHFTAPSSDDRLSCGSCCGVSTCWYQNGTQLRAGRNGNGTFGSNAVYSSGWNWVWHHAAASFRGCGLPSSPAPLTLCPRGRNGATSPRNPDPLALVTSWNPQPPCAARGGPPQSATAVGVSTRRRGEAVLPSVPSAPLNNPPGPLLPPTRIQSFLHGFHSRWGSGAP